MNLPPINPIEDNRISVFAEAKCWDFRLKFENEAIDRRHVNILVFLHR